jgi:hypothetical protein
LTIIRVRGMPARNSRDPKYTNEEKDAINTNALRQRAQGSSVSFIYRVYKAQLLQVIADASDDNAQARKETYAGSLAAGTPDGRPIYLRRDHLNAVTEAIRELPLLASNRPLVITTKPFPSSGVAKPTKTASSSLNKSDSSLRTMQQFADGLNEPYVMEPGDYFVAASVLSLQRLRESCSAPNVTIHQLAYLTAACCPSFTPETSAQRLRACKILRLQRGKEQLGVQRSNSRTQALMNGNTQHKHTLKASPMFCGRGSGSARLHTLRQNPW